MVIFQYILRLQLLFLISVLSYPSIFLTNTLSIEFSLEGWKYINKIRKKEIVGKTVQFLFYHKYLKCLRQYNTQKN